MLEFLTFKLAASSYLLGDFLEGTVLILKMRNHVVAPT